MRDDDLLEPLKGYLESPNAVCTTWKSNYFRMKGVSHYVYGAPSYFSHGVDGKVVAFDDGDNVNSADFSRVPDVELLGLEIKRETRSAKTKSRSNRAS